MKRLLFLGFLFFVSSISAQDYNDLLIDKKNTHIVCEIKQIKYGKVKYRIKGKSYAEVKDIMNFVEIKASDTTVIKNTLNLKIENPEPGYAHIYFYANERYYKVMQDKKKLVKLNPYNYFLLKVKAGEVYNYYCQGNHHKEDWLTIDAVDGEVYMVRGVPGKPIVGNYFGGQGYSTKMIVDNGKISRYALLTMKKKAKK